MQKHLGVATSDGGSISKVGDPKAMTRFPSPTTRPTYVGFRQMVLASSFCITIKFLMSLYITNVVIIYYDLKNLIVKQKLESRTVGLKPTKIGRVDRVGLIV